MPNLFFYIPSEEISKIIGLKGKHIKQLEKDHRVSSRIFKEKDPFPSYKTKSETPPLWTCMLVSGSTSAVFNACKAVADSIDDVGDIIIEYSMKKEKRQLFFHNGGLPIKQISALSDCRINVPVLDGPVQLECNNLDDAKIALDLLLAHAGLPEEEDDEGSSIDSQSPSLARPPRQPRATNNTRRTRTRQPNNNTNRNSRRTEAGKDSKESKKGASKEGRKDGRRRNTKATSKRTSGRKSGKE